MKRRLTSTLNDLEFEAAPGTTKDVTRRCRYCEFDLPHRLSSLARPPL
jgi:hypothetical protein